MKLVLRIKKFFRISFTALFMICLVLFSLNCFQGGESYPQEGPSGMDFYTPPSDLPIGSNGDLIYYREFTPPVSLPSCTAWTVMYHSTDAAGSKNIVTGTVLVPTENYGGLFDVRPIISYAIGTHGLCQECAPSFKIKDGTDYELSNIKKALQKGYAVLVTDNPGYINDAIPTYMSGIAQGHAVLDIIRAARQIPSVDLSNNAEVLIWGYSQGGQSAAWAGQLQPNYAAEINLVGVAAGGVPADFFEVAKYLDGNNGSAFLLETVIGLWSQYPEGIPLEELINEEGQAAVEKGLNTCVFEGLFEFMNTKLSTYVKGNMSLDDLMAIPSVHETLEKQTLGKSPINVPVYLYHGLADEFIPLGQSLDLKEKYCGLGVKTLYVTYQGEHIVTQFQAAPYVLAWFEQLLNGEEPWSTCGTIAPRPAPTANPVDEDFIVSLNNWKLNATVHLNTLNDDVVLPDTSTFTANTNMTQETIIGDLWVPPFESKVSVIINIKVNMIIESSEPMTGAAYLDNDGILHVHGHMYTNIKIQEVMGLNTSCQTEEPVDFPIDFDGPVSSLGDGTLTFTGVTTFPDMEGEFMPGVLTMLMSGEGQEYTFTVVPKEPELW